MDLKDFICQIVKSVLQCLKSSLMILNYLISLIHCTVLTVIIASKYPCVQEGEMEVYGCRQGSFSCSLGGAGHSLRPNDRLMPENMRMRRVNSARA